MNPTVSLRLLPLGRTVRVPRGEALRDALFEQGVEFPCGGRGRCKGCGIQILEGHLPATDDDRARFTHAELARGFRLACRAAPIEDLTLRLVQWEAAILADDSTFAFTPQPGCGIAIDLGTTTLVAQLVDRSSGRVLAVRAALNEQATQGSDIMSRVEFGLTPEGRSILQSGIQRQLGRMVADLLSEHPEGASAVKRVVVVGNTVMHHLFAGVDVAPLAQAPFEPVDDGLQRFTPDTVGWPLPPSADIVFLPSLGGFVGSDILAGILATRLHQSTRWTALMDLGTNGEMVVGNQDLMLCASTAAGPAFEGARITMGMRAATGAISEVRIEAGQPRCHVLGRTPPRGICGSGLVDAAACGLELGRIQPNGRLNPPGPWELEAPVALVQRDLRELQMAKGALAAGLQILTAQLGITLADLDRLYLAGAFGNYINRHSARRIGLIQVPIDRVFPAGNTALLGAKLALFAPEAATLDYTGLRRRIRHVALHEDDRFQQTYVDEMGFPERASG